MKKTKLIFTTLIIILANLIMIFPALSQSPDIIWQKEFGGTNNDEAKSISQTNDNGFIIAGRTWSSDGDVHGKHGDPEWGVDFWILRLNDSGDTLWTKCLGGSDGDHASSVSQTTDGGYIIAGYTESNDGDVSGLHGEDNYDYWVVRLNSEGDTLWTKCYGGSDDDYANSIIQTNDNGFIVAGYTKSNDGDVWGRKYEYYNDYWIVKLDSDGDLLWTRCYGGTSHDYANSIIQTEDGGYIIAGYTESNNGDVSGNNGDSDYWIVKINSYGDIIWAKCFGGSDDDMAYSILQTDDSGYLVAGSAESKDGDVSGNRGGSDYWCIKLDDTGNIEWEKCYGGSSTDIPYSVQPTIDGGYIIAGSTSSNNGDVSGKNEGIDCWIVKIIAHGYIQWQKCIGGIESDYTSSIIQTHDSSFVFAGYSDKDESSYVDYDYLIVKLENDENIEIFNCGDTLTDTRDGKKYPTAKIGNRSWMGTDLNYNDVDTFNFSNTICPENWHLPTIEDWSLLNKIYSAEDLLPGGKSGLNIDYDKGFWTAYVKSGPSQYYNEEGALVSCYNEYTFLTPCWTNRKYAFLDNSTDSISFTNLEIYRDGFEYDFSNYYYAARCVSNSFCPLDTFSITSEVNPPGGGIVTGTGQYLFGEKVTLTAIPDDNYNFFNWTENDSILSDDPDYLFILYDNRNIHANFKIKPPSKPTLYFPDNGEDYMPSTILLKWRSSSRAMTYHLQVSEEVDFKTFVYNDSLISDTSKLVGSLNTLTTYYWRVRSWNISGVSPYSEVWSFTVEGAGPPAIPVLYSPADEADGQPLKLTLFWRSDTKADTYHLQVSEDISFSELICNDSTITDTSFTISSLEEYTTYYWRVKAKNVNASSPYSEIFSYTTGMKPPDVPTLASPDNDSEGLERVLTLDWETLTSADYYHLQVSENVDFTTIVFENSTLTTYNSSSKIGPLNELTTYYWRVKAMNTGGSSLYSETYSFKTGLYIINPPSLNYPEDGSEGMARIVVLEWSIDWEANSYHFQVSESENFSTLVLEDSVMDNYPAEAQIGPLDESTSYYWRVKIKRGDYSSPYSQTYSFTTGLYLVNPPSLYFPADESEEVDLVVMLEWSIDWEANGYHFQVSESENFSTLVLEDSVMDNYPAEAKIGPLDASTTYYWRVKTKKGDYTSPYSQTYSFTTGLYIVNPPSLYFPADGSEEVDLVVMLEWSIDWEADSYHFQISESEDFSTLVLEDSVMDNYPAEAQIGPLDESTTYYWRVKIKKGDYSSPYSEVYSFTTSLNIVNPPSTPDLYSPYNGEEAQPITPELEWSYSSNTDVYHLQVATDINFTELVFNDSTITETYQTIGPLEGMTTYYWHVRAKNAGGYSSYSEVYYFITENPDLFYQAGYCIYSLYFTDDNTGWAAGGEGYVYKTEDSGALWETLETGTTEFLSDIFFIDSNTGWAVGENGIIIKTIDGGDSWEIQNSGAVCDFESVYFINETTGWIAGNDQSGAYILRTTDGGNSWTNQLYKDYLMLFSVHFIEANIGWAAGFDILKTTDGGKTWIECNPDNWWGLVNSTYFIDDNEGWLVGFDGEILKTNDGGTTWTEQNSGTTENLYDVFFYNTNLGWVVGNEGTVIKTADGGVNWVPLESGNTDILKAVYFVNQDTGWVGGICAIYKSETGIGDILSLSIPQLISPNNNSIDVPLDISLNWEAVENAESYHLQVSDNNDFISPVYDQSGIDITSQQIDGLAYNTTYYWHVNANGEGMASPWSETWNFTTISSTGINDFDDDTRYKIYPNPVNDKLFIEGCENELTNISILSLEGKLLKQIKEKGMVQIDVSDLQDGIYLVKIVNSRIMITEKIVKQ
jgi:photosystem II stability/assembly factor-like uncharacterized protein